jgi:hypothetical protein
VDKIKIEDHCIFDITDGYQLWKGAAPIFASMAIVKERENGRFITGPMRRATDA